MRTAETEERLRTWLDSNQVQRERLCAHMLPLLGPYSHVEPRRPKGGPDGARDIQARYEGRLEAWGAVGFRNSPKDDKEDKRWVREKFKADLQSAQTEKPELQAFVFFTNVDLTPGEQDQLREHAKSRGVKHVDVFYRESLRLVLDGIDGWGYRLMFLGIEMSREEQIAFFERFGGRVERMIEQQRLELRERLRRIEFLHDAGKPARDARLMVMFKQPLGPTELGHFRILLRARSFHEDSPHPTLWLGARDGYMIWSSKGVETPIFGVRTLAWSHGPNEKLQDTAITPGPTEFGRLVARVSLYKRGPFRSLQDFDRLAIDLFATAPLLDHIAAIGFAVNDYLIFGRPGDELTTAKILFGDARVMGIQWPEELSAEEQDAPWVNVCARGPDADLPIDGDHPPFAYKRSIPWNTDFEASTPVKQSSLPEF